MKFAVVVFPGSNCDHDAYYAVDHVLREERRIRLAQGHEPGRRRRRDPARRLRARRLPAHRCHRPLLADHGRGAPLCRRRRPGARHLQRLPGAARGRSAAGRDAAQRQPAFPLRARPRAGRAHRHAVHRGVPHRARCCAFRSRTARATTTPSRTSWPGSSATGRCSSATSNAAGQETADGNPNGSVANIAGLCNEARNVVGLMPHPERACELAVGSADGLVMLQSAVQWFTRRSPAAVAVRGASSLSA